MTSAEIMPPIQRSPRAAITTGFVCIALCFAGFGTWAAIAPLASAVIAPATVTVDGKRKKVQHMVGGIVKQLAVRDGDVVEAGQILLRLDGIQARAALGVLQGALDDTRAVEARLVAERDGTNDVRFGAELTDRQQEPFVAKSMRSQAQLFEVRHTSRAGQVLILRQRIQQLGEQIDGLQAQRKATERQLALLGDELAGLQKLYKDGHASRTRILALKREAAKLDGERGKIIADLARAKTAIGETEMEIIQVDRIFREEVVGKLRETQASLIDLSERALAARHVVDHIDIRAPVAGTVVGLDIHTEGGIVKGGETLLEIVPSQDRLVVEARLRPSDINTVAVGQDASVLFTAFKQRTLPAVLGHVVYVSADSLADSRTGEHYFVARIEVAADAMAQSIDHQIVPGMPAEVMIRTGERTALRYLAQPMLDSFNRAWREE